MHTELLKNQNRHEQKEEVNYELRPAEALNHCAKPIGTASHEKTSTNSPPKSPDGRRETVNTWFLENTHTHMKNRKPTWFLKNRTHDNCMQACTQPRTHTRRNAKSHNAKSTMNNSESAPQGAYIHTPSTRHRTNPSSDIDRAIIEPKRPDRRVDAVLIAGRRRRRLEGGASGRRGEAARRLLDRSIGNAGSSSVLSRLQKRGAEP